jgi:hypothetical protein
LFHYHDHTKGTNPKPDIPGRTNRLHQLEAPGKLTL